MTAMKQMALMADTVDVAPATKQYLNWFDNQAELMRSVLSMYNEGRGIELDPMFGSGSIHKNLPLPRLRYDLDPRVLGVEQGDARHIEINDECVESVLLDPPFASGDSQSGTIKDRYTKSPSERSLRALYRGIIDEAYRVLKPKGILVFKAQDMVSGGKKRWNTDKIRTYGEDAGFEILDTCYLIRYSPMSQEHRGAAQHFRSAVIQFIIMRKGRLSVSEIRQRAKARLDIL